MAQTYDLRGIVEFALRREVMAWRTYDRISQMEIDGETMSMILQLVGFEVDHVRQFTEILRPQIDALGVDVDGIVERAEREPIDLAGYIDEERLERSSLPELLGFATKFERTMAEFYEEAAAKTDDPAVRGVMERLAGEERSHEQFIGGLKSSLSLTPEESPEEFPSL